MSNELLSTNNDIKGSKSLELSCTSAIKRAESLFDIGNFNQAEEILLTVEKEARYASDNISIIRLGKYLFNKYFDIKNYDSACEWLKKIFYRRAQLKNVEIELVAEAYNKLELMNKSDQLKLIKLLVVVTAEKLYLEIYKARVLLLLSKIKEEEGDIVSAADLLQEVQIESNVHIDKKEKAHYLFELMRLTIKKGDYIATYMVIKRFDRKIIENEGFGTIKLLYYHYVIVYYIHLEDYANVSNYLLCCANTDFKNINMAELRSKIELQELAALNESELGIMFTKYAAFAMCIAKFSHDKQYRIKLLIHLYRRELENNQDLFRLCQLLASDEIISIKNQLFDNLYNSEFFTSDYPISNSTKKQKLLLDSVIHHSLFVCSKFYTMASIKSIADLIGIDIEICEDYLCNFIRNKFINGKINRLCMCISFEHKELDSAAAKWYNGISKTLKTLKECYDLIEKERLQKAV